MTDEKPTLIYIGDPMCSWCYGFSPELNKVIEHYDDKLDFDMVYGGLRPYNTQSMTELKDFLSHHWEDVNKASGQEFKYGILDSEDITYDTEPPSRACIVVRSMDKDKEYEFFKEVQKAFYFENKNLHLVESYHSILDNLDLDTKEFDQQFSSEEKKAEIRKDFEKSEEMGIRGFPSLVLKVNGELHLISNGYKDSDSIIKMIDSKLN